MDLLGIYLILTGVILQLCLGFLFLNWLRHTITALTQPDLLEHLSRSLANQIMLSFRGMLAQSTGVANRNMRKIENEVATNMVTTKAPWWLRGLLNLPQVQDFLGNNPEIIKAGASMLVGQSGNNNNHREAPAEDFDQW